MSVGERKSTTGKNYVKPVFSGGVIAFFGSIFLLLICSLMIFCGWIEYTQLRRLAIAACATSGFLISFLNVRKLGHSGIPVGVSICMTEFSLLLFTGLLMSGKNISASALLPLLVACLCSGALAGLAGRKKKKRRHT